MTFIGTGGVGKTSLSILTAIAAAQKGRRVAAITVDPSRRLSQVLEQSTSLQGSKLQSAWQSHLDVYFVDTEKSFSEFVSHNVSGDLFSRLSENRIYQQICKNLRETHNFAALYQMHLILEKKKYDLVVLDTPPCHQVVDFFQAPQRLENFFANQLDSQVGSWLGWVKNQGVKVAEKVVQGLVGPEFVREMDSFFRSIGSLSHEVAHISKNFRSHLTDSQSHISLLFSEASDKLQEASYLAQEIEKSSYAVNSYIMNRAFIPGLNHPGELSEQDLESQLYQTQWERKERNQKILREMSRQARRPIHTVLLPELMIPLTTHDGLSDFVAQMQDYWHEVSDEA